MDEYGMTVFKKEVGVSSMLQRKRQDSAHVGEYSE